ncbi:MAG: transketolase, partial [Candidatus Eremiobacteraeota bacterium]|nr:transketolase [Candidatus Eremiobacteraeota bacterium]
DHYTYCLCSDGDLMEGLSHEAASFAGHCRLGKLIFLYDDNKVSLAGPTDITFTDEHLLRFQSYGWHTELVDIQHGNDVEAVDRAITAAKGVSDHPSFIAIRTHIGYGSPKQDTFKAHGEPLGPEAVKETKEKLGWPLEPDFYVPEDVLQFYREVGTKGAQLQSDWQQRYDAWKAQQPDLVKQFERTLAGQLPAQIPWPTMKDDELNVATRESGGSVMNAIAGALPELVGGSADLDPSTKTYLKDFGDFEPGSYAGRNIHYGVREHGMAAINNGIAMHGGLLPFGATFFNFTDYMKPSMRLAAITKTRAIYVLTHDSIFLGEDGPTHQPIEQLASFRALPNMTLIRPADALEALEAWKLMIQPRTGPWMLVLTRQKVPFLGDRNADVARGAYVLVDCDGTPDLILIATGSEVHLAVEAAKLLENQGTRTRVVSMPCWELFSAQSESYRDSVLPPDVRGRMSIEAGATLGWDRWVGDRGFAFGIDRFGASGPAADIAKAYGFTPENIAKVATERFATVSR